jgi:hypothetical protein
MAKYALVALLLFAAASYQAFAFGDEFNDVIELEDNKNNPKSDFETQARESPA